MEYNFSNIINKYIKIEKNLCKFLYFNKIQNHIKLTILKKIKENEGIHEHSMRILGKIAININTRLVYFLFSFLSYLSIFSTNHLMHLSFISLSFFYLILKKDGAYSMYGKIVKGSRSSFLQCYID